VDKHAKFRGVTKKISRSASPTAGGIGIIDVGATPEKEIKEKKARAKDGLAEFNSYPAESSAYSPVQRSIGLHPIAEDWPES
jgi:hypothetical protein